MQTRLLGRTNQQFPAIWFRPAIPAIKPDNWLEDLRTALRASQCPIDVSQNAALWAQGMRGADTVFMTDLGFEVERAVDATHASNLVQARLIEVLSGIGRDYLDIVALPFRKSYTEAQIAGTFEALENARLEGHIRFLALRFCSSLFACGAFWRLHDGFDLLWLPQNGDTDRPTDLLQAMAKERRVGQIFDAVETTQPQPDSVKLVTVTSSAEVDTWLGVVA